MSGPGAAQTALALAEPVWRSDVPEGTCSVEGCEKPARKRGWCDMHHSRWLRYGDVHYVRRKVTVGSPIVRFMAKVEVSTVSSSYALGLGPCWLWTSALNHHGYGLFGRGGRGGGMAKAHRWSYEHFVGPIPQGLEIDHKCRVRACVNPAHLEPVTRAENQRRRPDGGAGVVEASKKAMLTHCKWGHPFDEGNTYVTPSGSRACRSCRSARSRRSRQRIEPADDGQSSLLVIVLVVVILVVVLLRLL